MFSPEMLYVTYNKISWTDAKKFYRIRIMEAIKKIKSINKEKFLICLDPLPPPLIRKKR